MAELETRDLRKELEVRELKHLEKRQKKRQGAPVAALEDGARGKRVKLDPTLATGRTELEDEIARREEDDDTHLDSDDPETEEESDR